MTQRSLVAALDRHQVRRVSPQKGERFDHKVHQAMFELPTDELPAGTVAEVMAPGYLIGERLLRAAMVGVAKAAPADAVQDGVTPHDAAVDTSGGSR
jgi:molecular chaperone GrpE